jgi:hypothetical protein
MDGGGKILEDLAAASMAAAGKLGGALTSQAMDAILDTINDFYARVSEWVCFA